MKAEHPARPCPPRSHPARREGCLPLEDYAALGDGRSVALSGADGAIDWWCVPNMDSPPLFDRLLSPVEGGFFSLAPDQSFDVERRYLSGSNVHETIFATNTGRVRMLKSLNSGTAGRLPWCELARRLEGLEGEVRFCLRLHFGTNADTVSPHVRATCHGPIFHVGERICVLRTSDGLSGANVSDAGFETKFVVRAGERSLVALIAGQNEPLVIADIEEIDRRIDISDEEWRAWSSRVRHDGPHRDLVLRSALALKLLLYSPSGAIAAAATTSLPERIGGSKNYDYRYAWIRDAGYTIKAFLRIGAEMEAKAALTWLINQLAEHGPRVMYRLDGGTVPDVTEVDLPGWRGSTPVRIGNLAASQHQHAIYGDIFETVERFVACGNLLDPRSAALLADLANRCADHWRQKDSGIWELPEERHYTNSKLSCWQALARAVELAELGQLPATWQDRWARERDRIADWIHANCWCEARQAFLACPGAQGLDASMALAVRFRFCGPERLEGTIRALDRELGAGPFHYRYSGVEQEEGCFLACTFWIAEAKALLGHVKEAAGMFDRAVEALGRGSGIYAEMVDPEEGNYLGNLPQGLTHLALIQAASSIAGHPL